MRRIYCAAALMAVVMTSCSRQQTVVGQIDGLTDGTIVRKYVRISESADQQAYAKDTIYADNGRFAFDLPDDDAYYVQLLPVQAMEEIGGGYRWYGSVSEIRLYVDKGEHIRVNGSIDSIYVDYKARGSQVIADYCSLRSEAMPLLKQSVRIMRKAYQATSDMEYLKILSDNNYSGLSEQVRQMNSNFILMHPDRVLSGSLLTNVPADSVGYYHDLLTEEVKESMFKPLIDAIFVKAEAARIKQEAAKRIAVGNTAPDFTLQTNDGKDLTLSSLRGKYVLLDFWGSWCVWCVKGFPDLKELYAKHEDKLEIVGVDCNESREKWLAAIEEYQLPWLHVYNPADAAPSENSANLYNVSSFPTKILLDPEGRILEISVGESPEFYDSADTTLGL